MRVRTYAYVKIPLDGKKARSLAQEMRTYLPECVCVCAAIAAAVKTEITEPP